MRIEIPTTDQETLAALATEAGFETVERYAAAYLVEIAQQHALADLSRPTEAELRASLAMCDRGMAEANAGEGQDFREVLQAIANRHGLSLDG